MKRLLLLVCIIFTISFSVFAQNAPYNPKIMKTGKMKIHLTNVGILDWWCYGTGELAICWTHNNYPIVFTHGPYLTGIIGDSIIGNSSEYDITWSPGPMIDGHAAMQVAPEDSLLYRVYGIQQNTDSTHLDYKEWPVQWGAPHYPDGTPKIFGDITYYTVYNDADTREEYRGLDIPCDPSPFEIHETIWGYLEESEWTGNILFFKYQIYNKGTEDIKNATFGMRTDIDIGYWVSLNWGGYDPNADYMYVYYHGNSGTGYVSPKACAYAILQGPCVDAADSTGFEFGKWHRNKRNLPTTFGWYIFNESTFTDPQYLATAPATLEEFRNIALGLKRDGNPIIHPLTGDTTSFTYDGDPISGEGWNWNIDVSQGGVGFIIGCSPFDLPAGDSTEVILAVVVGEGYTGHEALVNLRKLVPRVQDLWKEQLPFNGIEEYTNQNIEGFTLFPNYPNPFNVSTTIPFNLSQTSQITISIYDLNGYLVETVLNDTRKPGYYTTQWEVSSVSSGIYFIMLNTGNYQQARKCILLK